MAFTCRRRGFQGYSGHERAKKLFDGFGGMLSFELVGGARAAKQFAEAVTIPIVAPSLGGVETLITLPAATSHAGLTAEERAEVGVAEGLIRVSVGILWAFAFFLVAAAQQVWPTYGVAFLGHHT